MINCEACVVSGSFCMNRVRCQETEIGGVWFEDLSMERNGDSETKKNLRRTRGNG